MEGDKPSFWHRVLIAFSYLSILFVIPLMFVDEYDRFGAFHVRNGFMIFIITIIGNVILVIIDIVVQGYVFPYVSSIFNIAIALLCLYGIIIVFQGKRKPLWGISQLLDKFPI